MASSWDVQRADETKKDTAARQPKEASEFTKLLSDSLYKVLKFNNKEDFEAVQKGLMAKLENGTIKNEKGEVIWNLILIPSSKIPQKLLQRSILHYGGKHG